VKWWIWKPKFDWSVFYEVATWKVQWISPENVLPLLYTYCSILAR